MASIRQWLAGRPFWGEVRGQDLIEYALMAGFVAVAGGAVFPPVANSVSAIFSKIQSLLTAVG
jgi:Flp pilus assembly pilin Flp